MKSKLIRSLSFSFAVLLCLHLPSQSQEKEKPRKFGWSLDQKRDDKKEKAASGVGQDGKKTEADLDAETIRVETDLVVFDALVLSPNDQVVTELKKEDFEIFVKGKPQEIGTFAAGDEAKLPRSIVLIIDYSYSQLAYIRDSVDAAKVLVDSLNPQDRMAIVTDDIKLLVPLTNDKEALKKGLDSIISRLMLGGIGASMQLSALLATLKEMPTGEERLIIIQQTDGDEAWGLKGAEHGQKLAGKYRRNFSLADLLSAAEQSGGIVYTVIPGPQLFGLPYETQARHAEWILQVEKLAFLGRAARMPIAPGAITISGGSKNKMKGKELEKFISHRIYQHTTLGEISAETGGWTVHMEMPEWAAGIYSQIFSSIEQRYILGYYPTDAPASVKQQDVVIRVRNHPEYKILKRKTHYKLGLDKRK